MVVGNFLLAGKIVVVTGGGSGRFDHHRLEHSGIGTLGVSPTNFLPGINFAFVQQAIAARARVIVADLRLTAEAEHFFQRLTSESLVFARTDVTQRKDLEALVSLSEEKFHDVPDAYVAGAGVFEPEWSHFWADTETDDYASVSVNLIHPMKLTRIAVRALLGRNKPGVVLVVASTASMSANYAAALYCAGKHGVVGFVRSMGNADVDESVKVVAICPGMVNSPLWTACPSVAAQFSYSDEVAIGPEEVASVMMEMIQDKAYPGGTVLKVDKKGKAIVPFEERRRTGDAESLRLAREKSWGPVRELLKRERGVDEPMMTE
ncbi:MAG: hypothetical protein Q9187_000544 [Circinaria calcarea]